MELWQSLHGVTAFEITGADIPATLTKISSTGITILHSRTIDFLTAEITVCRQDQKQVVKILQNKGDTWRLVKKDGIYWSLIGLLKRPVLLTGMAVLIVLCCLIPSRIWFVQIEGNTNIPTNLILEQAAECGISFGASRRAVRSEKMKNALLEAMPQLQWAGVNTIGCVATISVRERNTTQTQSAQYGISSIVAVRDGLILSVTAVKGSPVCSVGKVVKAGERLISGYTDCGLSIQGCNAQGEVIARTERNITAITPNEYRFRDTVSKQIEKISVIIGKKRINFYKDSGILDAGCVKMVTQKQLTLPGGFALPVTLVKETWTYGPQSGQTVSQEQLEQQLRDFASAYLSDQMIAGQIQSARESCYDSGGIVCLEGEYACQEMIGRVQQEEIIGPDGKHD